MKTRILFLIALFLACSTIQTGCDRTHPPENSAPLTPEEKLVTVSIVLSPSSDTSLTGTDNVKTFHAKDTVHAIVTSNNATDGMLLTGRWFYQSTKPSLLHSAVSTIDTKIAENRATLAMGTNVTHFDLIKSGVWLPGSYKLLVYLDSAAKDSAKFSIVK